MEFYKFHHSLKYENVSKSQQSIKNHENKTFNALKINHLRIAFVSLVLGIIITILILLIEIFVYIKSIMFE
jgi:hypothetical protein